MMKKLLFLLLAAVTLAACGNDATADTPKTITIGMDETFAPMGFLDDNNEVVGFDVDLAKETLSRLGYKVEFQSIDWAMKETELNTNNIDLIWNGYAVTPERAEKVLLSEPYLNATQAIFVLKDSPIQTKSDLAGKVLSTQQSSSSIDKIKEDASGIYEKLSGELVLYPSNNNSFMDLEAGRVDAIVVGSTYGRYYVKEAGKEAVFRVLEEDFGEDKMAVALRKEDTELKKEIDATIKEIKADGTYDDIYDKWFFSE